MPGGRTLLGDRANQKARPREETKETLRESNVIRLLQINQLVNRAR